MTRSFKGGNPVIIQTPPECSYSCFIFGRHWIYTNGRAPCRLVHVLTHWMGSCFSAVFIKKTKAKQFVSGRWWLKQAVDDEALYSHCVECIFSWNSHVLLNETILGTFDIFVVWLSFSPIVLHSCVWTPSSSEVMKVWTLERAACNKGDERWTGCLLVLHRFSELLTRVCSMVFRTRLAHPTTLCSSIWVIEYYGRTVTCTLVFTSCCRDAWRIYFCCMHQIAGVLCVNLRQRGSSAPALHFTAGTVISFWQWAISMIQCTQTGLQELIFLVQYPVLYSVVFVKIQLVLGWKHKILFA